MKTIVVRYYQVETPHRVWLFSSPKSIAEYKHFIEGCKAYEHILKVLMKYKKRPQNINDISEAILESHKALEVNKNRKRKYTMIVDMDNLINEIMASYDELVVFD